MIKDMGHHAQHTEGFYGKAIKMKIIKGLDSIWSFFQPKSVYFCNKVNQTTEQEGKDVLWLVFWLDLHQIDQELVPSEGRGPRSLHKIQL